MAFKFDQLPRATVTLAVKTAFADDPGAMPKEEYETKWAEFGNLMAKVPEGKTKRFRGRVTKLIGPVPIAQLFKGEGSVKSFFVLTCILKSKGVEGLRFDNVELLASLNEKAKFNHLYYAVTGEAPEGEEMELNPGIVTTRDVWFVIKKEGKRTDNKRGGYWFKVTEFDEDEDAKPDENIEADAWREATDEEMAKYTALAELSMAQGRRVYRLPENMIIKRSPEPEEEVPAPKKSTATAQTGPGSATANAPASSPAADDDMPWDQEDAE